MSFIVYVEIYHLKRREYDIKFYLNHIDECYLNKNNQNCDGLIYNEEGTLVYRFRFDESEEVSFMINFDISFTVSKTTNKKFYNEISSYLINEKGIEVVCNNNSYSSTIFICKSERYYGLFENII